MEYIHMDEKEIACKCPISGMGKPPSEWSECIGERCQWFEGSGLTCAVLTIAVNV